MTDDIDLKELGVKGYTRFSIKAEDNEQNQSIHNAFKEFAKTECNNDYTMALKILMQNYAEDYRFSLINDVISSIEQRLDKLEKTPNKEEKLEMF